MLDYNTSVILLILVSFTAGCLLFKQFVFPKLVEKWTVVTEKNPKWITSKIMNTYYGFSDVDFLLVSKNPFGSLPSFRISKDKSRLEFLIPEDTPIDAVEELAHTVLVSKLKVKYNIWLPEKPTFQLSIILYLLDGGDIKVENVGWEDKNKQETC